MTHLQKGTLIIRYIYISGRKTHKCPYCSRTFLRANSDLQKHIWIHEGVKPFKCSLCPHACRSKNNLAAHMLRHSSEKPFLCTECGKAYKSKTALRWHIRSHKDGKIFKCTKYVCLLSCHLFLTLALVLVVHRGYSRLSPCHPQAHLIMFILTNSRVAIKYLDLPLSSGMMYIRCLKMMQMKTIT